MHPVSTALVVAAEENADTRISVAVWITGESCEGNMVDDGAFFVEIRECIAFGNESVFKTGRLQFGLEGTDCRALVQLGE